MTQASETRRRRREVKPRVIEYERPWLYREQEDFLFTHKRFSVVEASTKTGKTVGCIVWLVEQALLNGFPGYNGWWVAPIYSQAAIAYSRIKRFCDPELIKCNDGKLTITFPNGAMLWFKGADNTDSLYGEDVYAAVIDEASRCKEGAWFAIYSTLTATKGKCRIIGNVKGRRNWAYKLGQQAKRLTHDPASDFHYSKLTAWHAVAAGIVDAQTVLAARRDLPLDVFRELYLAEASDDGGNPFGLDFIKKAIARQGPELSKKKPVCFGVDLARSMDWLVCVGLDEDRKMCRFDRWNRVPWAQSIQRLRGIIGSTPALFDSTGVGDPVTELAQRPAGLTVEATERLAAVVAQGPTVDELAAAIRQERQLTQAMPNIEGYKYSAQSKQVLMEGLALSIQAQAPGEALGVWAGPADVVKDELEVFEYEYTRTGVRYTAPEGFHDDTVNALALANRAFTTARYNRSAGGSVVNL